jgi:microcin C transport system permease protein
MLSYIARRVLLMIPTLLGIMVINFVVTQAAPGGPVETLIARIKGEYVDPTARFGGGGEGGEVRNQQQQQTIEDRGAPSKYRGARGLDPEFIKEIEKQFGFDKPMHIRFIDMMGRYLRFDFGESYFRDRKVVDLIIDKFPVSITIGFWTTLFTYLIAIPLGIAKAVEDGTRFDVWTSATVIIGNAIPEFLFAIFLIVVFAGGSYFDWFPLRGLLSEEFSQFGFAQCATDLSCVGDYLWHITLPVAAMVIGGYAGLTMLTKNSFIDEINKQYVTTARAKGLSEGRVLYGHVFRNAMLLVIAGFPGALIGILFAGTMFIELIFSLDGLGLLGFEAALNRDYSIMFATLYAFGLFGLFMALVSDLTYTMIDPRIDFESREV